MTTMPKSATIYHNPRCSTSRTVLETIRGAGVEPKIIEYLKTPPTRDELRTLLDDAGRKPSEAVRKRESLYKELGLADADEETIFAAMVDNPILIERPIVVTDKGTRLARPPASVTEIL
jgi:arsenate reductase (glutaredoxin)